MPALLVKQKAGQHLISSETGALKLNSSSHFKVKFTGSHLTNEKTEGGSTTLSSQSLHVSYLV